MRIRLIQCSRGWKGWRWPALLVVVWLGLGLTAMALSRHLERPVRLCWFKNVTGVACPTCGFTRGIFSLRHGHPIEAWLYNPLLFSFLVVLGAGACVRVVFRQGLEMRLTRRERILCWAIALVAFAVNWLYVIRCVG